MKELKGFNNVEAYTGAYTALPPGGYVCGIREAWIERTENGEALVIKYDISQGEHKSYFQNQFNNSSLPNKKYKGIYRIFLPRHDYGEEGFDEKDEKALRGLKTFIENVQDSNTGYLWNWNEHQLALKYFGGIFGEKEYDYDGRQGVFTTLKYTVSVLDIQEGNYKIPALQKLKTSAPSVLKEVEEPGELPF